jgi:hypothetical protein
LPISESGKSGRTNSAQDEAERYRVLVEAITDYAIYMLDPGGAGSDQGPEAGTGTMPEVTPGWACCCC